MTTDDRIFLHYSKSELDRNFDQRGWITNAEEIIARNAVHSGRARSKLEVRSNIPYGNHPDEVLDIFLAPTKNAPVQIFVHGGAWKNFTKDDYSFPALAFSSAGMHTVILNFSKLPAARIPDVVDQVRRAIIWTHRNIDGFGGNPDHIYMSAHSSGAHLTAAALLTDWAREGLPSDVVKAAACVSGPYDLKPVMLSARSSYVALSDDEVDRFSPTRHAEDISCPIFIAYADGDTDEFRRQSVEFADALKRAGRLDRFTCFAGLNHFEVMEEFARPESSLVQSILAHVSDHENRIRDVRLTGTI